MNIEQIIEALNSGIENTQELLAQHDRDLGRTTPRNKRWAEQLEDDINSMQEASQNIIQYEKEGHDNLLIGPDKSITPDEAVIAIREAMFIIESVGTNIPIKSSHISAAHQWINNYFPRRL